MIHGCVFLGINPDKSGCHIYLALVIENKENRMRQQGGLNKQHKFKYRNGEYSCSAEMSWRHPAA